MSVLGSLFKRALALELPWEVREVEFIETGKRLNVWIDFGARFCLQKVAALSS